MEHEMLQGLRVVSMTEPNHDYATEWRKLFLPLRDEINNPSSLHFIPKPFHFRPESASNKTKGITYDFIRVLALGIHYQFRGQSTRIP